MTLSGLARQDAERSVFLADLRMYARSQRLTISDYIRHGNPCGKGRACKGRGQSHPHFGSPTNAHTVRLSISDSRHAITDVRKGRIFSGGGEGARSQP